MKTKTTMFVGLMAIVVLIAISATLGVSLVVYTEQNFRQLASQMPSGNQTADLSKLSLGEAVVISMFDGSQSQLRGVILQAADETLTGDPRTAPSMAVFVASVAGAFIIGIVLSRRTTRSMQKLLLITKAVASGKYDSRDLSLTKVPTPGLKDVKARGAVSKLGADELTQMFANLEEINERLTQQQTSLEDANRLLSSKNRELAEAIEKLKVLDGMKTDFINIAAHEIKNPVQPLLNCASMVKQGLLSQEEGWKMVEKQSEMLKSLTESILDVSRIENGVISYEMKPVDLNKVISDVVSSFSVSSNGLGVKAQLKPSDSCFIMGDMKRMTQVLTNLIGNSMKFTTKGSIVVASRVVQDGDGNRIELKVTDTGCGIPKEILPVVFDKFVTKSGGEGGGTGLGLFITKAIVEAHRGQIRAENNGNGVGATFTILIPQLAQSDISVQTRESDKTSDAIGA